MLKDIPGYKAILKSVLKSQIQLLIEQLAENTGEESIILTASVNDGTLSHLGSNTGKGFLEGRDEIKSQFLGYCLKTHHKKKSEPRPSPYQRPNNHSSSPGINNMTGSPGPLVKPAQKRPRVHPVALQRAGDDSPIHATGSSPTIHPGNSLHSMSPVSSDVKQEGGDSRLLGTMSPTFTSTPSSFPSSLQLSHTQTSTPGNNGDPGPSGEGGGAGIRHSADESNDSSATNIKIEPITENEMELEITGVEPGNSGVSEGWDPTQSGYSGVGSGDDSLSQGADQAGYTVNIDEIMPRLRGRGGPPIFQCPYCNKIFGQNVILVRHMRRHTGEKPFVCDVCSMAFTRLGTLRYHRVSKHPDAPMLESIKQPGMYS